MGEREGEGGSLTPGGTLSKQQLMECLDFDFEAAEARIRHNATLGQPFGASHLNYCSAPPPRADSPS